MVYLRNDGVPWKSDFASRASENNKIATCSAPWGTRNDDSGTAFEVPAGLDWGYETFGIYPIVSLAFKFEQYAVVAERPLRQSFNL